jgi:FtsZ-binding cell division protein ZapB
MHCKKMPKNKIITLSVFTSRQEEIYRFLKKQDASVTNLIWNALDRVYLLSALFDAQQDRIREIDKLEKIKAAIDTISLLEGELIRAKLLAQIMGIDFSSMSRSQMDSLSNNDRSLDSLVESEGSTKKKCLPKISF